MQDEIRRLFQQKEKDLHDESAHTHIGESDSGRKVKVYFTGGAITRSTPTEEFASVMRRAIELISKDTQIVDIGTSYLYRLNESDSASWFVTPYHPRSQARVYFHLEGFELCEQQGITDTWKRLAKKISVDYEKYDGFVVIHWLKNMEYTASALSFMLDNLRKPIIFTGGLRSLGSLNNDSSANISGALLFAGNFRIPEVCIFQNGHLFRANRTICSSSNTADCFASPNLKPLALLDTEVTINWDAILVPPPISATTSTLKLKAALEKSVTRLYLNTSTSEELTKQIFFAPGVKAVLLEAYGRGNIPTNTILHDCIEEAAEKGVPTFVVSQCHKGAVTDEEIGNSAVQFGAISCGNMVPAAAFIKIAQLMSAEPTLEQAKEMIRDTIKGDISEMVTSDAKISELGPIESSLHIMIKRYPGTNYNLVAKYWLLPSIFFNAVRKGLAQHAVDLLKVYPSLFFEKDNEHNNFFHMLAQCKDKQAIETLLKIGLKTFDEYKEKLAKFGMTTMAKTTRRRKLSQHSEGALMKEEEHRLKTFSDRFATSMIDTEVRQPQTEILSEDHLPLDDLDHKLEQTKKKETKNVSFLSAFAAAANAAVSSNQKSDPSVSALEFERIHTPLSAYLQKVNIFGYSPLSLAIKNKTIMYVMKLKKMGATLTSEELVQAHSLILDAARENNLQTIMLHYYAGIEKLDTITDMDGRTIAHIAAFLGHLEILVFLRNETKFDLRKKDSYGNTPLDEAAFSPTPDVARLLDE